MPTIREVLSQFLAEKGEGNRGSMSSPFSVIDLFGVYLNDYGHENLNEFERSRFDKEWKENHRFCDIFGPAHIQPYHINSFLNGFVIRKVAGTKGFLKACGLVMEKFAQWLLEKKHWDVTAMKYYRELVGLDAGRDLVGCDEFGNALLEYVEQHPVDDEADDIEDNDYLNDQFTIRKVERGKVVFDGVLEGDGDIVISLPKAVVSKAKVGWSVTMEIARINKKWRIVSVGNVYP